ncbi:MAG: DUF1648 domain-containing protein [Bacteroidota bacterium]
MENQRPILQIPKKPVEITLDVVAIILVIIGWAMTYLAYTNLPESVPIHYGVDGAVDRYGSKDSLIWLSVLNTVIVAGLSIVALYPHKFNFPVKITHDNAQTEYSKARMLIISMKFLIAALFVYITNTVIEGARNHGTGLGWGFAVILGALVIAPFYVMFRRR